ncbi:MAG: GntR family transcriptional regulator [Aestuariivirga sp.]|nr:GntR family transcriptional regulator [Aestuariivirga sp.]
MAKAAKQKQKQKQNGPDGLVDRVYAVLLDTICSGRLPPGTRLGQEWLAERLNVSRQPVGHALALMKSQGFVCDVGRRGLMVATLKPDYVEAVYAVRGALDRLAASRASQNCKSRDQARTARAKFGRLVEMGDAALGSGSISGLISADIAFHGFIYELSGNVVIGETMEVLWNRLRWVMSAYLTKHDWAEGTWGEHKQIIKAILAGDGEEAERLALNHVRYAVHLIKSELERAESTLHPGNGLLMPLQN